MCYIASTKYKEILDMIGFDQRHTGVDASPVPFLSIVTRCCDRPDKLQRAIDSVKKQIVKDYEHVFILNHREGLYKANRSFEKNRYRVRGEYVFILDDDNEITNIDFIKILRNFVASTNNPEVIMVRVESEAPTIQVNKLPPDDLWEKPPEKCKVDTMCFVIRRDVWLNHIHAFGVPRCGDFNFINEIFKHGYRTEWLDCVVAKISAAGSHTIKLPNVTMLSVDCIDHNRSLYALHRSMEEINCGAVKFLTSIECKSEGIEICKIPHIDSKEKYSEFCMQNLPNYIDGDFVLIVQHDGYVLNKNAWDPEFLNYDYIGATIKKEDSVWWSHYIGESGYIVGNGGFSIRSKKLQLMVKDMTFRTKDFHPEDFVICAKLRKELEAQGIKFAPVELAQKFALSMHSEDSVYNNEFGWHGHRVRPIGERYDP